MQIVALAGGIGASKLLVGLNQTMDPRELTIVVNTGDDIVMHGLAISPDLDIVTYSIAGVVNPETGWGFRDESFHAHEQLGAYGRPVWFHLGDRDLATHIHRTAMLREGATLSEVAESIRSCLGVRARILPMSDQPVPTMIATDQGRLHFQEYLVQRRTEPIVRKIEFDGIERAQPAPGVLDSFDRAAGIVLCPSNPLISIGPILGVAGVREALQRHRKKVVAVCPIVGGKSLKGPSDKMLLQLGFDASCYGVARLYQDICATFVIDSADAAERSRIESLGMKPVVCSTVMRTFEDKQRLAGEVLRLFEEPAAADQP
jgi:LPPG:FO 2-phospho-L-lactate transferase